MKNLKPNSQRAKTAITLIWIVLVVEIISLISGYFQYNLMQTALQGGFISDETASANDTREQLIGLVYLIVYIFSSITFIQWFSRAVYNLQQKAPHLSFSAGHAVISWFIPVINLFRPYDIMNELYVKTKELVIEKGGHMKINLNTSKLSWWWSLWLINIFLMQFILRYFSKAETIDEFTEATITGMIGNIIGILLALITIKIIRDYSNIEHLLIEVDDPCQAETTSIIRATKKSCQVNLQD